MSSYRSLHHRLATYSLFPQFRTVIEEADVMKVAEAYGESRSVIEIVDALKWRLSVQAEHGTFIDSVGFYFIKSSGIFGNEVPVVTLLYSYDDTCVTIHTMRVQP